MFVDVIELARDALLSVTALNKLSNFVAAEELLVVTVFERVMILLCKIEPLLFNALVRFVNEVADD